MVTIYITVEDYYNNGVFSNSKFNLAVSELPKSYNYVEFKIISTKMLIKIIQITLNK